MPKCVILMLADFCFITTPAVAVCQICHVLSSFVTLHYCFSACLWNSAFGFLSRHFIGTSMTLISTKVAFLLTMEAMFKSSAVIAKLFVIFFSCANCNVHWCSFFFNSWMCWRRFFQASMATVSACCKWHIMLESYWCTAVLYPHQMCNKCFGPAAARVFITCAAGVKGKLE